MLLRPPILPRPEPALRPRPPGKHARRPSAGHAKEITPVAASAAPYRFPLHVAVGASPIASEARPLQGIATASGLNTVTAAGLQEYERTFDDGKRPDMPRVGSSGSRGLRRHSQSNRRVRACQLFRDSGAQRVVLRSERGRWICPVFAGVQPDRISDPVGWFPVVARPHVRVQKSVGVAEDLKIDAAKRGIGSTAGALNCLAEPVHAF